MNVQPLGDYCLATKVAVEDVVINGIINPTSQRSLLSKAKVIAVGPGSKIAKFGLNEGDIIFYNEIENNAIASESTEKECYFIRYDFIYGKEINN